MLMASLPSGSHEDVELVKIETEDFTLVIKGKPFHERYKGLKQYRAMDVHDTMEFTYKGKGNETVQLFDIQQQRLVNGASELRPIFFENGIYQLLVMPKKDVELNFYHEHSRLKKSISKVKLSNNYILMGNLSFQNEVGLTTFEIREGKEVLLEVTMEIFPTKLDYKRDYYGLLEEVNSEIYNLAYHFIRKTFLGATAKSNEAPSMVEFYRLINKHFQKFLLAIDRIERQPHHQLQNMYIHVRGDQLRKPDINSRNYLRKRPSLFLEVNKGIPIQNKSVMPKKGLQLKKELTYDTLENRFVKYMMERLDNKLADLLERLGNRGKYDNEKPDSDLLEIIQKMIKQLKNKQRSSFWKRVGKLKQSVFSLVLQMAPGYRDAYQIFLTVSKGLVLEGKFYQMSIKDVATLYEYWTFLKIGQILQSKYELLSQNIVKVNREGLFVNLETGRTAKRVFQHPVTKEKIILTYQKYERNLPTIPQKPDTMLSIEKKGKHYTYQYIFDAKYRIEYAQEGSYYQSRYKHPGPMEEDINTMHRYRDSIVAANHGPYERTSFGAYVLFPWSDEDIYQEHHFYKSINEVNIGALPFLPNAITLVEQFIERLIDSSPEVLQREGVLPIGTKERWLSSLDEKVLVGLVKTKEDYISFIQNGFYQIPVKQLKKGWQEAKYIALYLKKGVGNIHGIKEYGKIVEVSFIQQNEAEYVKFHIVYWSHLKQVIFPVHYGIATYAMTTMNLLEEAQELPELFMKSKNEIILWRMLRRVSDNIKIQLDQPILEKATGVESFGIKDIAVYLDKEKREILFRKGTEEISVEVDLLDKKPSQIFKLLVQLIEG